MTTCTKKQEAQKLFRTEAVQAQTSKLDGAVIIASKDSHRLLTGFYLLIIVCICIFVVFGTYTRRATAVGVLRPIEGFSKIYPGKNGVVTNIFVKNGDTVKKGQSLFELTFSREDMKGSSVNENLASEIKNSILSLERLQEHTRQRNSYTLKLIEQDIKKRTIEIEDRTQQIGVTKKILKTLDGELKNLNGLKSKGYTSDLSINRKVEERLNLNSKLFGLKTNLQLLTTEKDSLALKKNVLEQESLIEVEQISQQISGKNENIINIESMKGTVIKSPVDGKVSTILVTEGKMTESGKPLLTILPRWSLLEGVVYIPAAGIGFVHEGQKVELKYQSLPYQKFGSFDGTIESISESTILPGEINAALSFQMPVYELRVSLKDQNLDLGEQIFPVLPGMAAEIDIVGDRISIFDWIFEPVAKIKKRFE